MPTRTRIAALVAVAAGFCALAPLAVHAQSLGGLRIFGYFQSQFELSEGITSQGQSTSFQVQQLNLFFRKPITDRWSAFVNFELVNSFSTTGDWGDFNLEEAWVMYRRRLFNVKMGMLIPTFNHLNEFKNRTPLLPYIMRPLVYETSLGEIANLEQFVPGRAYIETSGFFSFGRLKLDHAFYVGNSSNVRARRFNVRVDTTGGRFRDLRVTNEGGRTGSDTTSTYLVGGRIGLRMDDPGEMKVGFSVTRDETNLLDGFENLTGDPAGSFREMDRIRLGADVMYRLKRVVLEGEYIWVEFDENTAAFDLDLLFYYGLAGYMVTEPWFVYATYWRMEEDSFKTIRDNPFNIVGIGPAIVDHDLTLEAPSVGTRYRVNDGVVLKAQFTRVKAERVTGGILSKRDFDVYSLAVSVSF